MKSEQIAELESSVIRSIESFKEDLGVDIPMGVVVGVLNVISHKYINAVIVGEKAKAGHSPKPQENK